MLLDKSGETAPERLKRLSQSRNNTQLWMCLLMKVKSNVCKEQYCIGTWNVRSTNRGKLEVVKQEIARVNIDILGISELNGQEWANLVQMTVIFTTVGKIP